MGEMDKTREQLVQELSEATKRIREMETAAATSGKISSMYHGIFENFIESATDSFSMWDSKLNLTYINKANLRYLPAGTKKSDVIGKNIKEMIPGCEQSGRYEKYLNVLKTGEPLIIEDFRADPKYGDVYLSIKVFKTSDGIGIIASDVTERRQAEEALHKSEEKLRAVFDAIGDSVTVIDINGNITDVNDAALKLFGCKSKEDVLGMHSLTFIAEENQPSAIGKIHEGKPARFVQYKFKRMDGSLFWGETSSDAIRDKAGNITGFVGIVMDITERKRIEDALRQSEERLRTYFENAPDAIFVYDFNGIFLDGNKKGAELTGYSKADLIGKNFTESGLFSENYALKAMNAVLKDVRGEATEPEEYEITRKDGQRIYLEATSFVLSSKGKGEVIGIARDISKRKHLEKELNDYKENLEQMVQERTSELAGAYEELRESEERLSGFFENVPDILFAHNLEGQFTDINKKGLEISGYSRDEIVGKNVLEVGILPPDQIEGVAAALKGIEEGKSGYPYEVQLMKKDGDRITIEAVSFPIKRKGATEVMGIARNITERKRMENALKNSEEKLRTMFTSLADGVVVTDLEGNFKDANIALLHMFGYSEKEDVLGINGFDFIAERDRDLAMNDMVRLFREGLVTGRSWTFKRRGGEEFQAELSTALLKDAKSNPTDILVVMRDITERKRMEKALRDSEAKLRAIYDSIGDGITVTDLKGTIIDQNAAGILLSGYNKKGDVIGRNGLTFISATDRDRARNDMFNVLQKGIGITTEYKLVDRNGREFDAEVSGALIKDSDGNPSAITNVIRDVTERKHIEAALRESETKYRTLVEQSEQGICIIQDGRIVFANNALAKINGYSLKEMYALSPDEFLLSVHPDDREAFVKRIEGRLKGDKLMPRHEYRMIRKDGAERSFETYAKRITYKGKPAIQSTIADITERKQWEEKLKKSKDELRFYLNQVTKAQEEERRRIARELHDDTIQEMIALSRQLEDLINKDIPPDEDRRNSRKKIEEAQQKVDTILKGIRRFTRDLRPSVLDDLGLVPALEWLTSDMSAQLKIPIDISIIGTERNIAPDAALAMFRIAQESLRNAGQHSKASQIQLNLKYTRRIVSLKIVDDGKGFTTPKQISTLTKRGKLGIAGMYERAQLVGATLSIKSKRNEGTAISLEVPV